MAVDKEAIICLSRVYSYYSKCNLPLKIHTHNFKTTVHCNMVGDCLSVVATNKICKTCLDNQPLISQPLIIFDSIIDFILLDRRLNPLLQLKTTVKSIIICFGLSSSAKCTDQCFGATLIRHKLPCEMWKQFLIDDRWCYMLQSRAISETSITTMFQHDLCSCCAVT